MKARDIISNSIPVSDLSSVAVRLGGFHLLMSFMGSIGCIMAGSGLKELFYTIHAENSIEKMMDGYAYAWPVRAHILSYLDLVIIVLESVEFTEHERAIMEQMLSNLDRSIVLTVTENESVQVVTYKLKKKLKTLKKFRPTAKLWVYYFRMITLVKSLLNQSE